MPLSEVGKLSFKLINDSGFNTMCISSFLNISGIMCVMCTMLSDLFYFLFAFEGSVTRVL